MKSSVLHKLLIGFFCVISPICIAEDLMEIYRKAVLHDPQILGAKNTNNAANESVTEAASQLLPQVNFQYSRGKVKERVRTRSQSLFSTVIDEEVNITRYDDVNRSLSLTMPLYNRAFSKNYQRAESELLQSDAEFLSIQQDLILRTAERYLEALSAKNEIGLVLSEKVALQRQLKLVQVMMRSGNAPKSELYDVQARYASVEADEINARNLHNNRLEALREIVGDISGELAVLKPDITLIAPNPQNSQAWIKIAVEKNPQIIVRSRAVDASRHQIAVDKSGHLPVVNLSANITERDNLESSRGTDEETRGIFLTFDLPLYQGGSVSARTRRSYELYEKVSQDLREIKYSIQRSTLEAYNGIISAISRINALNKSVDAQSLALEQRKKGFRSGLYTTLDVLDAERDVYESKRDYANARYDYFLNWLRLKHSAGIMTEADVREVNQWLQKEAL